MPPITPASSAVASGDQMLASHYNNLRTDALAVESHVLDHTHRQAYYGRSSDSWVCSTAVTKPYLWESVLNPSGAARPTLGTPTNGTGTTTTLPTGSTGDLLILAVVTYGSGSDAINIPSGWNALDNQVDISGSVGGVCRTFWKIRGGSESAPTLSGAGYTTIRWVIVNVTGVSTSKPFLGLRQAQPGSQGTTVSTGAVDFLVPDNYRRAVLFAFAPGSTAPTWTAASGWTDHADVQGVQIAYLDLSTSQATTATDGVGPTFSSTATTGDTTVPASTTGVVVCSLSLAAGKWLVVGGWAYSTMSVTAGRGGIVLGERYDSAVVLAKGGSSGFTAAAIVELGLSSNVGLFAWESGAGGSVYLGAYLMAWRIG